MNREGIRRLAAEELKLPTSPYAFADSLKALRRGGGRPGRHRLPVRGEAGHVLLRQGPEQDRQRGRFGRRLHYAATGGRVDKGRVIVEGFIDFDYEITLLTVRALNAQGQVETHFCEPIGHIQVKGDYVESWQPQPMSALASSKARAIAAAVTGNLGGQGLFGVELFVKGDAVWFSEVSPRPHDTGMVTMISQRQSEFELHARAILAAGGHIPAQPRRLRRHLRRPGSRRRAL